MALDPKRPLGRVTQIYRAPRPVVEWCLGEPGEPGWQGREHRWNVSLMNHGYRRCLTCGLWERKPVADGETPDGAA